MCSFIVYPILSMRLLKLFNARSFGPYRVLAADWRLQVKDIGWCQAAGGGFIGLYTLGIWIAFAVALWHAARPSTTEINADQADAAAKLELEQSNQRLAGHHGAQQLSHAIRRVEVSCRDACNWGRMQLGTHAIRRVEVSCRDGAADHIHLVRWGLLMFTSSFVFGPLLQT